VTAAVLVLFGSIAFFRTQSQNSSLVGAGQNATTQNGAATATAHAITTSNVLAADPLDGNGGNIHGLPLNKQNGSLYAFKGNAYHITANSDNAAIALLQGVPMPNTFVYTLTVQAIKGDETDNAQGPNTFGMIFCFNTKLVKGNKTVNTFYAFEVLNKQNGEYQFLKYDDSKGDNKWTTIWHHTFGKEFKQGHGSKAVNNFKVQVKGSAFTFTVNNKAVKTVTDKSYKNGIVGMIVNLQGTEVAFSKLLLTTN
jgi:hypothetical protein